MVSAYPVRDFLCMTHYIYVLYSLKDKQFYVGYTSNLQVRVAKHKKRLVFSTKTRLPMVLIYYEASRFFPDARAREKYLKSGPGRRYLRNRLKHHLMNL